MSRVEKDRKQGLEVIQGLEEKRKWIIRPFKVFLGLDICSKIDGMPTQSSDRGWNIHGLTMIRQSPFKKS